MQTMTGKTEGKHSALLEVLAMETGERAAVHGLVHTLRDLGDVRFALLRMPQGVLQCVLGADEDRLKYRASLKASAREGLYFPFSSEMTVCRDTPSACAKSS